MISKSRDGSRVQAAFLIVSERGILKPTMVCTANKPPPATDDGATYTKEKNPGCMQMPIANGTVINSVNVFYALVYKCFYSTT